MLCNIELVVRSVAHGMNRLDLTVHQLKIDKTWNGNL